MTNARGTRGHFEMRRITEDGASDAFTRGNVIIGEEHVQKVISSAQEMEMHRSKIRQLVEEYLVREGLAVYPPGHQPEELVAH